MLLIRLRAAGRALSLCCLSFAGAAWAEDCDEPFAGFRDLAERLEDVEEVADATILNAELMVSPSQPCRGSWIVEILTAEGDVVPIVFDARTLEERGALLDLMREQGDEDVFPAQIRMTGTAAAELFDGDWSDDVMEGGPGPDLFVVSPGTDAILDFNPAEDVLQFGDFAEAEEELAKLRSLTDLAAASSPGDWDGRPALVVDLDGAAGDFSLTLVGVEAADLTGDNAYFDWDRDPPFALDGYPGIEVELSEGSVVLVDEWRAGAAAPDVSLLSGDEEAAALVEEAIRDRIDGFMEAYH